jgi:hypothetical protein
MTAQIGEKLCYEGREVSMCSEPLGDYFALSGIDPGFDFTCTALWRGYVGAWDIQDGRLYLIGLNGTLKDGTEANVATFFPGFSERVFAHWYSGKLRIPVGEMLEYVHMGYGSTYEEDLIINVENGVVTKTSVQHNGAAEDLDGTEGYGIGAMTVFPRTRDGNRGDE